MSNDDKALIISRQEAARLLDTGNWVTDLDFHDEVSEHANELRGNLGEWTKEGMRLALEKEVSGGFVTEVFSSLRDFEVEYISHLGEVKFLEPAPPENFRVELRISSNAIYKIGPTASRVAKDTVGLILVVLTGSPYGSLLKVWAALSVMDIVRTLAAGYEKLEKPIEVAILHSVHSLSAKLSVINYDAIAHSNFEAAYGKVSPHVDEITSELSPDYSAEDIRAALQSLKTRKIIQEKSDRWHITF